MPKEGVSREPKEDKINPYKDKRHRREGEYYEYNERGAN